MELTRVTIWVEEEIWERLKSLPDPSNKKNASHHAREALRLYLKVLETEAKIFEENRDQELDKGVHANSSFR